MLGITEVIRLAALERDDLFQPRSEAGEVGFLARGSPFLLGERSDPRRLLDQCSWQPDRAVVNATPFADVHRSVGVRIGQQGRTFDGGEQFADTRIGGTLV